MKDDIRRLLARVGRRRRGRPMHLGRPQPGATVRHDPYEHSMGRESDATNEKIDWV